MRVDFTKIKGKSVVGQTGKLFGEAVDIEFNTRTGELQSLIVKPTEYVLEHFRDMIVEEGKVKLPFRAVTAIGDFVIINEEEIS